MNTETHHQSSFAIVLSGGGCRTFWSLGVLHRIAKHLPPVTEWAGVSAGSAMAVAASIGAIEKTLDYFMALTSANKRNIYPSHVFGQKPIFPHENMYRSTILHVLKDGGFETLKTSAPVRILLSYIRDDAPLLKTVWGSARTYRRRKKNQILHGPPNPHPGLVEEIGTAQLCPTPENVCDLILASSCTPPITRVQVIGRRRYADGGLIDHAPVRALSQEAQLGKVLVLTSRHIPRDALPGDDQHCYFSPSRPSPVAMWDYSSARKVKEAFDLGCADGLTFMGQIESFLEDNRPSDRQRVVNQC